MTEAIVVAIVSGLLTLVGTIITVISTSRNQQAKMETRIAVLDQRIDDLTKSVEKHNRFAERLPVLEEKTKENGRRIDNLEKAKS